MALIAGVLVELGEYALGVVVLREQLDVHEVVGVVAVFQGRGGGDVVARLVARHEVALLGGVVHANLDDLGERAALRLVARLGIRILLQGRRGGRRARGLQVGSVVVFIGYVSTHARMHLVCGRFVALGLVLLAVAIRIIIRRLHQVVARVARCGVAVAGVHVFAREVLKGEPALVGLAHEVGGDVEDELPAGHLEVVAGELLCDLQSLGLVGVAHDVERVDEGVELLHREVVGDECLCAGVEAGYGELHGVVVQTAHRERSVGVAAADVGHLFSLTCACAIKGEREG